MYQHILFRNVIVELVFENVPRFPHQSERLRGTVGGAVGGGGGRLARIIGIQSKARNECNEAQKEHEQGQNEKLEKTCHLIISVKFYHNSVGSFASFSSASCGDRVVRSKIVRIEGFE